MAERINDYSGRILGTIEIKGKLGQHQIKSQPGHNKSVWDALCLKCDHHFPVMTSMCRRWLNATLAGTPLPEQCPSCALSKPNGLHCPHCGEALVGGHSVRCDKPDCKRAYYRQAAREYMAKKADNVNAARRARWHRQQESRLTRWQSQAMESLWRLGELCQRNEVIVEVASNQRVCSASVLEGIERKGLAKKEGLRWLPVLSKEEFHAQGFQLTAANARAKVQKV